MICKVFVENQYYPLLLCLCQYYYSASNFVNIITALVTIIIAVTEKT